MEYSHNGTYTAVKPNKARYRTVCYFLCKKGREIIYIYICLNALRNTERMQKNLVRMVNIREMGADMRVWGQEQE